VTCNYATTESVMMVIISGEFVAISYHMLPALKQNLDSHRFKDDYKMEMAMMQSLITAYKNEPSFITN